jgi:hypothetical protein
MEFKIDGIGLYKNRRGDKIHIIAATPSGEWLDTQGEEYLKCGQRQFNTAREASDADGKHDIISRWAEPLELENLYPNCDNPTLRTGDEKKFYIVYSPDGLIRKATQHKNPWLARKEVDELVKYHSGSYKFYVMEAIACFEASVNVKEREVV